MSGWQGRQRHPGRKLSGWEEQKRARRILRRFDGICHVCGQPGADQVDHVIPLAEGGRDDETNLRPIHAAPCHREKTRREAARGRAQAPRPSRRRAAERHPGVIDP